MKIFVYDSGTFGTAMGVVLARVGHEVTALIQTYDYPHLKMLLCFQRTGTNEDGKRENNLHLSGVELPPNFIFTDELCGMREADIILLAVPCKYIGEALLKILPYLEQNKKAILVLLSKGFDDFGKIPWGIKIRNRLKLWDLNSHNFAVLSGATFAHGIIQPYQDHWVSVASDNLNVIKKLYAAFYGSSIQLQGTTDLVGVSWGGGLKNAYTIGYGLILKQAGEDAAWKYIWLALKEMKVFLDYVSANPKTLMSPAVERDFYVTCRGESRNRKFGQFLAEDNRPHKLEEIKEYVKKNTVEGYDSMLTLWKIAQDSKLNTPLLHSIHAICEYGGSPNTFVGCFERVKAASH